MHQSDPLSLRSMSDEQFWRHCRWEAFRGSGPGGQKRNKTSSAVRVIHEPTGMAAVAEESRSQSENRQRAFRRLRKTIAFDLRVPIDLRDFHPPEWWAALLDSSGRLRLSPRSEHFLWAGGFLLDVLHAAEGSVADAARLLGLSTANVVKMFSVDPVLWDRANRIRAACGLKLLKVV